MLQKLLIAFCTVFLLSACGSSSNDGPAPQDPPPVDDTNDDDDSNGDDDDANGDDDDDANGDDDDANGDDDDANGDDDDANGDDDDDANGDDGYNVDGDTLAFEMGSNRWGNNGSEATLNYDTDNDTLVMTPDFTMVECPQDWDEDALCTYAANHTVDGPLDLRGTHFVFELEISQSILDNGGEPGGIVLQAYGQENGGDYDGYWGCEANNQDIASTDVTFECTMPEDEDALNFPEGADTGQVGLQVLRGDNDNDDGGVNNDIEGTITMKSFRIYLDGPPPSEDDEEEEDESLLSFTFADGIDGWYLNGTGDSETTETGNVALSHSEEQSAMVITPLDWSANNWDLEARTDFEEAIDLTDATVTFTVTIPEAYIDDGDLAVQMTLVSSGGDQYYSGNQSISGLEADEQSTIVVDWAGSGDDLTSIATMGLQLAESPADDTITDDIWLHSVEVQLAD